MSHFTHVLDTSALLAHYFGEPGAERIDALWAEKSFRPAVSVVTVAELNGRLASEVSDHAEAMRAADTYVNELTTCLPVDRATAELAWQLQHISSRRLPLVDALIAATARAADAVLVHKDPHFSQIPGDLVRQIDLTEEQGL